MNFWVTNIINQSEKLNNLIQEKNYNIWIFILWIKTIEHKKIWNKDIEFI